ncbi:MAG: chemotaxis protein CheW [Holophaga sp.]|nr:chemotaxis protein CheW [Holophaga sp.]
MNQYSTFRLGDRLFGLDLMMIREINRILDITPVPHSRSHIRGLINLRGQIVTILDLGVRLGLARQEIIDTSHNIILKTSAELATVRQEGAEPYTTSNDLVGFLVDAIGDVVEADESTIEPPSANVSEAEGGFLSGVIKTDAGLLVLLDIHEILHGE